MYISMFFFFFSFRFNFSTQYSCSFYRRCSIEVMQHRGLLLGYVRSTRTTRRNGSEFYHVSRA